MEMESGNKKETIKDLVLKIRELTKRISDLQSKVSTMSLIVERHENVLNSLLLRKVSR